MKCSKLLIWAAVLFFGTAYGQKTSESKPKTEEVIYKRLISQKEVIMVFVNY